MREQAVPKRGFLPSGTEPPAAALEIGVAQIVRIRPGSETPARRGDLS
jgi:hypothetical protein